MAAAIKIIVWGKSESKAMRCDAEPQRQCFTERLILGVGSQSAGVCRPVSRGCPWIIRGDAATKPPYTVVSTANAFGLRGDVPAWALRRTPSWPSPTP